MATLTAEQIYVVALGAGFPPDTAVKMVAIALKESSGDTTAHNSTPPDDSYGLWQINMYGSLGPARLAAWGLSDPSDLFDPNVNAAAAYSIWGGNDANLAPNWFPTPDTLARYQSFLPTAQAAATAVTGATGGGQVTGGGGTTSTGSTSFSAGRLGAPPVRPVSTSAPLASGGLGSQSASSSPLASPASLSSLMPLISKWWWLAHLLGAFFWGLLVHAWPNLSVPVGVMAPIIHGALPSPALRFWMRHKAAA